MYYTKYRPQKFSEVQRPNEIADALMQQLKTGKTVHAYLFTGPRGIGKTTMARLLAKGLSCESIGKDGDVCGKCAFCLAVQNGNLLDLTEIDAASNRGIDDIRDLKEKVRLLPTEGKKKVYIIDEVHMLTNEAFNALLKPLEEPPKHAVFILCTTEFHKVPETIKSRCQVFRFKRPTRLQIVEKLKRIADAEVGVSKIAQADLERVAIMAGGAFRDAENILQQLIEGGVGDSEVALGGFSAFIANVLAGKAEQSLKSIQNAFDDGIDLTVWCDGLIRYMRDLLYIKMGFADDYFALDTDALEDRKVLADKADTDWLIKAIETFNQAQNELKMYSIPQLALEIAVVKVLGNAGSAILVKNPVSGSGSPVTGGDRGDVKETKTQPTFGLLSATVIKEKWREVIAKVLKINNSVSALLKSGKPICVEDRSVVLEVSYRFHKERLESTASKRIVEKVLEEVFDQKLTLKCVVCQRVESADKGVTGNLTDLNVRIPANVVEVFDGELPL